MITSKTPHKLHLLVCTNARHDGTPSCGDSGGAQKVFEALKAGLKAAKLPVRVSRTGCLGPCAQGPNVMCYRAQGEGVWWQGVGEEDVPAIEAKVREMSGESTPASLED